MRLAGGLSNPSRLFESYGFIRVQEILDLREGMTAEFRYRPMDDRFPPSNHPANPRIGYLTSRGPDYRVLVYAQRPGNSRSFHRVAVILQTGEQHDISANQDVSSVFGKRMFWQLFSASGAPATVQQHRTRSAASHLLGIC